MIYSITCFNVPSKKLRQYYGWPSAGQRTDVCNSTLNFFSDSQASLFDNVTLPRLITVLAAILILL